MHLLPYEVERLSLSRSRLNTHGAGNVKRGDARNGSINEGWIIDIAINTSQHETVNMDEL